MASRSTEELISLSLSEAAELVRDKKISPVELTRACLERIEAANPELNAFITVTAESALQQARAAEDEIQGGHWRGPLHGIPISLKDLIDTAGVRTTAASALYRDRVPEEDAEVVRRLRAAGAIVLGKTNLHEFAYGGSGLISHFGPARNPWDPERITGGSSSGSAAAVAAGLCFASIGSDTAGSVRLPAAYCGIVGIKPSYGLVPLRGVIPLSWSYDHVGPLARSVRDAAIVLRAVAGYDPLDITSRKFLAEDYAAALDRMPEPMTIGIASDFFFSDLQRDIEARVKEAVHLLLQFGDLREVRVPVDRDRTVASAETFAYHAEHVARSPELYDPETLRRIRTGAEVTATAYIQKRQELDSLRRRAPELFKDADVIVTPTVPIAPPAISELVAEPTRLRPSELLMLRNTRPFNVLGLPAISVPCGFTSDGLPVGLQIAGPPGSESAVLRLAYFYEQTAPWRLQHPR
ncbi:MAG: amidase [Acidobacteriia bacterium]|nr:amidase [Terriglobia bacterium]